MTVLMMDVRCIALHETGKRVKWIACEGGDGKRSFFSPFVYIKMKDDV